MDSSLVTFLSGLKISPELAAFVALVLLFLIFIWRAVVFGIEKVTASQQAIATASDHRLAAMTETVERIADKFQTQLDKLDERAFDSQMRFQDQLKTLTESHVLVSRDHIAALNGVASRLEHVERVVGEFPRPALPRPKAGGFPRPEAGGGLPGPPDKP